MAHPEPHLDVRAVVVHYRTPDLLQRAVESWFHFYPDVPLTIFDNAPVSDDAEVVASLRNRYPRVDYIPSPENVGHGPGMDRSIRSASEAFIFLLDSDTVVQKGGFLEAMIPHFERGSVYGVGRRVRVNRRGYNVEENHKGFPALDPAYMLIRRTAYLSLPPFIQHGQPVVENFSAAMERGLELVPFDIGSWILHEHRGTVNRHGYGLGLRGKINHILNMLGL